MPSPLGVSISLSKTTLSRRSRATGRPTTLVTAGDLVGSIPRIDALAAGVLDARVLNKKNEGSGLLKDLSSKAQFDEVVVAQRLGEGHRKPSFDRLVCDL